MAYGLKMYNTFGVINLTDDSKALRLHDSGIATVPARTGSVAVPPIVPGSKLISITPVNAEATLEVIDRESTLTAIDQWNIFIDWSTPVDNHWTKISLTSYALTTRDVLWKVWVHL